MPKPDIVVTIDHETNPEGTPVLFIGIDGKNVACVSQLCTKWLVVMMPFCGRPDRRREWADNEWEAVGNAVAIYQEHRAEVAA